MKLIIGLGNTGTEYENTRHNAGFMAVDFIREHWQFENWQSEKKIDATLSRGSIDEEKILLIKPHGYINESGKVVAKILHYYRETFSSLLILHDDLDISPGQMKKATSSRSAGHNGVQDIINTLGTQDFTRIRIGIGRPNEVLGYCQPNHDYVLERFTPEEKQKLTDLFLNIFSTKEFL